jgi:hypothetical protein
MLTTVCPRLGGGTLVLAPCERLGDPAPEVRYWRDSDLPYRPHSGRYEMVSGP